MGKVVEDRDVAADANRLETPLDAFETRQPRGQFSGPNPDVAANRDRREGVTDIVDTEQRRIELAERLAAAVYVEPGPPVRMRDVQGLPRAVRRQPERFNGTDGMRR